MKPKHEPLISVVIPTYNREDIITDALNSVYQQTYRPLEIIVVDDGSTDNTTGVVSHWIRSHSEDPSLFRTQLVYQRNGRAPAARNKGIRSAKGKYVQFLDSDDILYGNSIRLKFDAIQGSSCLYAYSKNHLLDCEGTIVGTCGQPWPKTGGAIATYLFDTIGPLIPSYFFDEIGGWDESLIATDEIELHGRLKARYGEGAYVDEFCHAARDHAGPRVSQTPTHPDPSSLIVIRKLIDLTKGSKLDTPAERNAISRLASSITESYAKYNHDEMAMQAFELAKAQSTGKRRTVFFLQSVLYHILPAPLFCKTFIHLRKLVAFTHRIRTLKQIS
ncbi:Glycosyl transferase family 2 [Neorhodopirellula lusitana]|uniref:Glycosyl transferase family 2 n=1 Tax=Neorhodopirellula lusitana TaxID=445327 RepID=A0ABY1QA70_9BACT|nr:glycosyltransferase family A protein [Neorhodopirellula lusitana]SMP62068.1 Glycosyl transferase family 2 [Neorhodopirellula lusitana]